MPWRPQQPNSRSPAGTRSTPSQSGALEADLVAAFDGFFPAASFSPAQVLAAATKMLDEAYKALWAIRSNEPGWRDFRFGLGWIAVSGFDDSHHRPVNVPTAPYPQFDISFTVPVPNNNPPVNGMLPVATRFMVASAGAFVGPASPEQRSLVDPDPALLQAPATAFSPTPVPRSIPSDIPSIPAGNKIIVYIHGGGSRAEEAVEMANWFILEGHAVGQEYTVISFDLPNSGYGGTFELTEVVGPSYDHSQLFILRFEQQYIINFIEALDQQIGNVKDRIVAVMWGSLGGNTSLLMTDWYDASHPYLQTIVSWSVTAMAPSSYLGVISAGNIAAYLSNLQADATSAEAFDDHSTEASYIQTMYAAPLSPNPLLYIPPQPIMWFRGGYAPSGGGGWQPCKDRSVARSRFDRYEIYSPTERHWTIAIDLEQISFSFQDSRPHLSVVTTPAAAGLPPSNLMLVAGDNDNFFPNAIYNSTIDVARSIRLSGQGRAEFWLDTGHSIHNERPRLFAREIISFLTNPGSGSSPNGTVVSTPPKAAYSMTDR